MYQQQERGAPKWVRAAREAGRAKRAGLGGDACVRQAPQRAKAARTSAGGAKMARRARVWQARRAHVGSVRAQCSSAAAVANIRQSPESQRRTKRFQRLQSLNRAKLLQLSPLYVSASQQTSAQREPAQNKHFTSAGLAQDEHQLVSRPVSLAVSAQQPADPQNMQLQPAIIGPEPARSHLVSARSQSARKRADQLAAHANSLNYYL